MAKSELEDFEAFLDPSFDTMSFANGLLLATNDGDNELDLVTPIKKLKFDIDECEKRMNKISSSNYESLIENIKDIEVSKDNLEESIEPQLQRLNNSFDRIKTGLMTPYEEAVKLNKSLKKMHTTLNLLRGAGFFMFLVQQLEENSATSASLTSQTPTQTQTGRSDLIKAAKVHNQLAKLFEANLTSSRQRSFSSTGLMSIKLVRDYQSIHLLKRADLISECVLIITEDTNHVSTFSFTNSQLQDALIALYVTDSNECFQTIDRVILNKKVQTILSQLTRALQSPRNFTSVIEEISESSENFLSEVTEILENTHISDSTNLAKEYITFVNEHDSLAKLYWSRVTLRFKKNIAATMARGGPIAKNLKIYHDGINKAVNEKMDPIGKDNILEALDLIGGLQ